MLLLTCVDLSVCYDSVRNAIWTFSDNNAESWKNLGLTPKHAFPFSAKESASEVYPPWTPEAICSKIGTLSDSMTPLQILLLTIAHMDRLARQHPIYGESMMPSTKYTHLLFDYSQRCIG